MTKRRIEYIDAMRGTTILLVVCSHVSYFCFGINCNETFSYNSIITEFRMPLFFMISGFVFYKFSKEWHKSELLDFLIKKSKVQLLTPTLFVILFAAVFHIPIIDVVCSDAKCGYWFTYALMWYFILYLLCKQLQKIINPNEIVKDTMLILLGLLLYFLASVSFLSRFKDTPYLGSLIDILGIIKLQYFLFFILGTRIKKYFNQFENQLDKGYVICISIVIFIISNLVYFNHETIFNPGLYLMCRLTGVIIIFGFFRYNNAVLSNSTRLGLMLQFVGRRTLDIYLIHYFFVHYSMIGIFPDFNVTPNPFLEFVLSLIVSVVVVSGCLLCSGLLRQNQFVRIHLFGQKQ